MQIDCPLSSTLTHTYTFTTRIYTHIHTHTYLVIFIKMSKKKASKMIPTALPWTQNTRLCVDAHMQFRLKGIAVFFSKAGKHTENLACSLNHLPFSNSVSFRKLLIIQLLLSKHIGSSNLAALHPQHSHKYTHTLASLFRT